MTSTKATDISSFAATQLLLLDDELQAEVAEVTELVSQSSPAVLQRAGMAILNLVISSQRTGLGGRTVVDLELDSAVGKGELPEHAIRTGDIVSVQAQPAGITRKKDKSELKSRGADGVVVKVTGSKVAVALKKEDEDLPPGKLWV
jgi:DNA polymerase alpha-associated DNA helicase A